MATTEISWTEVVWNPTTGCDKVSPGCDHCYAMTMAKRLKGMGQPKYQNDGDPRTSGPGFGVTMHPDALHLPMKWRKPKRIFVNSMSDLFHDKITDVFIARVFGIMARCPQHTFQVLTKRHARMRSLLSSPAFRGFVIQESRVYPLPNVMLGVSTEDQKWADIRIPALLDTPAAVRWISAEPLLGPIDLTRMGPRKFASALDPSTDQDTNAIRRGLDWVVVGGESGPGARPMDLVWATSLRDQCAHASIPFHFKQGGSVLGREWGGHGKGGDPANWPEPFPREYPTVVA